jgi:hypothetical protein
MVKIIDNFLSEHNFSILQNFLLHSAIWKYSDITTDVKNSHSDQKYDFFFIHKLSPKMQDVLKENFKDHEIVNKNTNFNFFRCNANLTLINSLKFSTLPHVDMQAKHLVALLYVIDSDGDTSIYKRKYELKDDLVISDQSEINQLEKLEVIKPKANRLVLFDGWHYHSYFYPQENNRRIVINMNILT